MNLLTFQGYSDDTFACEGRQIDVDHDNCGNGKPVWFHVKAGNQELLVMGQYASGPSGGWMISVAPVSTKNGDENPIADWPISISRSERPYSPLLTISAPDDVTVSHLQSI
jgi:hypothetical protein